MLFFVQALRLPSNLLGKCQSDPNTLTSPCHLSTKFEAAFQADTRRATYQAASSGRGPSCISARLQYSRICTFREAGRLSRISHTACAAIQPRHSTTTAPPTPLFGAHHLIVLPSTFNRLFNQRNSLARLLRNELQRRNDRSDATFTTAASRGNDRGCFTSATKRPIRPCKRP